VCGAVMYVVEGTELKCAFAGGKLGWFCQKSAGAGGTQKSRSRGLGVSPGRPGRKSGGERR
jgi:hypothetical protein